MAATPVQRSKTAPGAEFRRIARLKGAAIAVFAIARKLATFVYRMLRYGQDFTDAGEVAYELKFQLRRMVGISEAAKSLGHVLTRQEEVAVAT